MAIQNTCISCGFSFTTSSSVRKLECYDCDGTNEAARESEARWEALPLEEKIEVLRKRLDLLENRSNWGGRIG